MAAKYPEDSDSHSTMSSRSRSLDDLLTCLICTEPFENPKVLPCNHTFCSDCLDKYYTACQEEGTLDEGGFPCPVCRSPIDIPANGITGLLADAEPKPGQIKEIVEKITNKRITCDVCKYKKKDINARHHCTSCTINYCAHCSDDHNKHTLFQNHAVIPVHQMEQTNFRCEIHESEVVKYYCTSCCVPLCTICAVAEHKGHKTMDLHAALGNKKESIENMIMSMADKVGKQENLLMQLEDLQNIKDASLKKTKVEIERHVGNLIAQLKIRKEAIVEEMTRAHDGSMKQIALEKENVTFELANMKSLWKFAVKLTEPSQHVQLLAMHQDLVGMIDNIIASPDPRMPKECVAMNMFMPRQDLSVGELQKCEISSELLGRVSDLSGALTNGSDHSHHHSHHHHDHGHGHSHSHHHDQQERSPPQNGQHHEQMLSQDSHSHSHSHSPLQASPLQQGVSMIQQAFGHSPVAQIPMDLMIDDMPALKWLPHPKLVWKVDKIGSKIGEISETYDVAIMPDGSPVVAEWMNHRIQIFDGMGNSRDIISPGEVQPWGVAVTKDGNLAVTDEKDRSVKVFSPIGQCLVSWKKNTFGWPRGIVITSTGQYIVTDTGHGKHYVSIHLPNGQCIRKFGSQGSGTAQFHWPRYVTVDHRDRIIVSDSSNHCIKVFDSMGQFLFKFGTIGNNDGQMKHPRGVCVDPDNNILVADQDNHRISIYGTDGKFIRHILTKVTKPWGVALSPNGFLAVTQKPALTLYKIFEYVPV